MADKEFKDIVPLQHEGAKKDIEHVVTTQDINDARILFDLARNRLLDINSLGSTMRSGICYIFRLTDQEGNEINRRAEKGDYLKLDIPGPGSAEGKGRDWVYIEALEEIIDPDGMKESIAIRVRPTSHPKEKGENVAHFLKEESTNSIVVIRQGTEVKAVVYARNEVPNTSTSNVLDKVRNAVVAMTAILGFSNIQWKDLVKGLLSTK